jgi:hypothetical protein
MDVVKFLNELAEQAGFDEFHPHAVKVGDWGDLTSTTILYDKSSDDIIPLNPIKANPMKDYIGVGCKVPADYYGPIAVHRAAISLGGASRIKSVADLKYTLKLIINAGLEDILNQVGFLHNVTITMKSPSGAYFKMMEDSNGIEFRLYVSRNK